MTGRPQTAEAAPYYFTYINQVIGDDALGALENQLEESQAFLSTISEEKSLHRYAPDKWSIRQVLNHVTDTERAFAFRALSFARGLESPLPSYDQNVAASSAEPLRIFAASSAHSGVSATLVSPIEQVATRPPLMVSTTAAAAVA